MLTQCGVPGRLSGSSGSQKASGRDGHSGGGGSGERGTDGKGGGDEVAQEGRGGRERTATKRHYMKVNLSIDTHGLGTCIITGGIW